MKVIITRPEPDAAVFASLVRGAGAEAIVSPVMAIRFLAGTVAAAPGEALAFTSANGVRAFARASHDRTPPVYAVGEATAQEARRAGFLSVAAADGDVDSLADLISTAQPPRGIVHLAGSDRAGDLVAALALRGVPARRLVIYEAAPLPEFAPAARAAIEAEPENCAVALFSPRSATLFLAQAARAGVEGALLRATALALSEAVVVAAGADRWAAIKLASQRSVEAMTSLVATLRKPSF
ncbi:MAG: uroporphyrinogen-III synthase [Parvularculaceae bacterium]